MFPICFMSMSTQIMSGHLGILELAAVSLGNTGIHILVVGRGPWRNAELGSNVKVLGASEPSQLSEFYSSLDVFVNPTLLRPPGLGLTLMEAMHCGKSVLTPNYPSIMGKVVINEGFGFTFSPNVGSFVEALQKVIRDGPGVLHRKGMACKDYALSMFTKATIRYVSKISCPGTTPLCRALWCC